jgi:hypothetical protein
MSQGDVVDTVVAIFFLVGFSIAVGLLASRYNRSSLGWFLFSIVLTPVLGVLFVLALGPRK